MHSKSIFPTSATDFVNCTELHAHFIFSQADNFKISNLLSSL